VAKNTMEAAFRMIVQRSGSLTFRRSFSLILIVEAVTIFTAWFLLDANISRWTNDKAMQAVRISQKVAASADWSLIGTVPKKRNSKLFEQYRNALTKMSQQNFPQNQGAVYLVVVDHGEDYIIAPSDQYPMDDDGKASKWELAAYATGKTTYNVVPYSDNDGTYLAANTPIYRNGKVVGLLGAQFDSATYDDFEGIVRKTFWLSIVPAILLSLVLAYFLATMFVEPMEIFRRIDETAAEQRVTPGSPKDDPLSRLSAREREVAELVRRGLKNKEIADELVVSSETVKQHLKNIREKTGLTRVDLAVQAEASRILGAQVPATT